MKERLLIITDTTKDQINGVVNTLSKTTELLKKDFDVFMISPNDFRTFSLPSYKEIKLSVNIWKIGKLIEDINPDYIHLSTEGPVGLAGKLYCDYKKYNYTSSYHSKFPEFIQKMYGLSANITYPYFKWFHSNSKNVMIPTTLMKNLLESKGFSNLCLWKRGVDRKIFNSTYRNQSVNDVKYILCVSRISKEKGLDDFCKIAVPEGWVKVLVGDGPYLNELKSKYKSEAIVFMGKKTGKDLIELYANAEVFVFPSKEDTFGLTQLEAISCGTPVVAYKNTVSDEIVREGYSGYLVETFDFGVILAASQLSRKYVEDQSYNWTWKKCTEQFKTCLVYK